MLTVIYNFVKRNEHIAEVGSIWKLQRGKLHHPLISQGNGNILLSYMKYRKRLKWYVCVPCKSFLRKGHWRKLAARSGSSKVDKALGCWSQMPSFSLILSSKNYLEWKNKILQWWTVVKLVTDVMHTHEISEPYFMYLADINITHNPSVIFWSTM